jgi:hypothetical protein
VLVELGVVGNGVDRRRTSLGGPPLLATPIAAEGVTAIRFWVAAIRLQEAVTGLSGQLPRRYGEQIRRTSSIQRAVSRPWVLVLL